MYINLCYYAFYKMPFNITKWILIFIELSSQLEVERNEVQRLENEKREWLSRGVHAEFEKKDKVQRTV